MTRESAGNPGPGSDVHSPWKGDATSQYDSTSLQAAAATADAEARAALMAWNGTREPHGYARCLTE
eukprot:2507464-Rhodomonas_salina.1